MLVRKYADPSKTKVFTNSANRKSIEEATKRDRSDSPKRTDQQVNKLAMQRAEHRWFAEDDGVIWIDLPDSILVAMGQGGEAAFIQCRRQSRLRVSGIVEPLGPRNLSAESLELQGSTFLPLWFAC